MCGKQASGMQEQNPAEPQFEDMHGGDVAAAEAENDALMAEEAIEEDNPRMLDSSREGYEYRKDYSVAFCEMALDMFLENMPEDLPMAGSKILDRQVWTRTRASAEFLIVVIHML